MGVQEILPQDGPHFAPRYRMNRSISHGEAATNARLEFGAAAATASMAENLVSKAQDCEAGTHEGTLIQR